MRVSPQTLALIRLAVNPAAEEGEANNAARAACRQLVAGGILGDSFVMPEVEEAPAPEPQHTRHDGPDGSVHASDVGSFFAGAAAAAASARRYAEAEDKKRGPQGDE